MMKRILRAPMLLWRDERGVALPLALMALLVLGALSAALLTIGSSEVQIAYNHLRGTQAHFLAEAGIERAFAAVLADPTTLTNPAGLPANGNVAGGTFALTYQAAGPNTLLVVSTGTTATGAAQRVLRATLTNAWNADDAVRTNDDLTINGNPTVLGQCGSVHTNDGLDISGGSVVVEKTVTASGAVVAGHDLYSNQPRGPIQHAPGNQPRRPIPPISAADMLEKAKANSTAKDALYWLKSDGTVSKWNPATNVFDPLVGAALAAIVKGPGTPQGWEAADTATATQPAKWVIGASGPNAPTGTFYVDGDIVISGNPGPWTATLIAADTQPPSSQKRGGDIVISGNPEMAHHMTGTLLVADRDIEISGNPGAGTINYEGYILAHEQVKLNGNPSVHGSIIAEDAANASDTVIANSISGNAEITFNCGAGPPLQGPLQIIAWGP